jgi:arylsulfatase A-like enzyme
MGKVNPYVKSPHIDEMADRGVFFTHNCVTTSICWQSRATLVTGMYVSKHGQLKISDEALFKTNDWTRTLYPLLRKHGYHTGFVGKWHAPLPGNAAKQAFDYHNLYYGSHWMPRNGKRRHVTDLNNEDAIHYLKKVKPKNKKFALTVSFFATHSWDGQPFPLEYQPQEFTENMYENKTIPTPKTATDEHWKRMPPFFDDNNEARRRWSNRYNTPDRFQETMKRYYRMAHEVDVVIGNVIQEIKNQGLYNNTLFIFTTDNGMFHGDHGLAGKWYPHEESIRVPLVIQDPRMPANRQGTTNDKFTLNIDLAPTILSAAGIPVPDSMQGRDIAQLYLANKPLNPPWRKDFFYEWNQGSPVDASGHDFGSWIPAVFALVRRDYKYFYWPMFQYEQVFHVEKDPFEEIDLFPDFSNTDDSGQSQKGILVELKERYAYLKNISQAGQRV